MKHQVAWMLAGWLWTAGCVQSTTDNKTPDVLTAEDLIAVGSLLPDEACVVSPDSTYLLRGTYDVSDNSECTAPYMMALSVENHLPAQPPPTSVGPSGNLVQITLAHVSLLNPDDSLIALGTFPNPFNATSYATLPPSTTHGVSRGVALVEVIPSAFGPLLTSIAESRGTVVAVISVSGQTLDGMPVKSGTYRFPIQLCVGCLTLCRNSLSPEDLADLTAGICKDNSGADGRVCIVEGC